MKIRRLLASVVFASAGFAGSSALAVTYNFDWTGGGGYSLTGQLVFDDSLLGTGVIDETQITELYIDVLLGGVSQGVRSLISNGLGAFASTFNLNFDTGMGQFLVGGFSASETGQDWFTAVGGLGCETVGFTSGSAGQGVCVGGDWVGASFLDVDDSTLTATLVDDQLSVVPLPAAGLMLLSAVALGGLFARRRKKT